MAWASRSVGVPRLRHGLLIAASAVAVGACSEGPFGSPSPTPDLEVVGDGFDSPVHLTAPAGDIDRLFVVEQAGTIRIIEVGQVLATAFLDIAQVVGSGGERGLLSLAFHPNYTANGLFFVSYTDNSGDTQVVRYSVSANPNVADAASALTVLSVDQPFANHNGGQVAFGPDGMLYIGLGDGGSSGDPQGHGQNPATLLGSMLRIDVDNGSPYSIPGDNPFVGHPTIRGETWAYGLRNPWRFSFDRATGDLYIADVGQGQVEEVSLQLSNAGGGQNYGWNTVEGLHCFSPPNGCDRNGLELPIYEYSHGDGCSITGGFVYRGLADFSLRGRYFFGDYCRGWIRSFRVEGEPTSPDAVDVIDHTPDLGLIPGITSFGEDGSGEIYVLTQAGTIYRVVSS